MNIDHFMYLIIIAVNEEQPITVFRIFRIKIKYIFYPKLPANAPVQNVLGGNNRSVVEAQYWSQETWTLCLSLGQTDSVTSGQITNL